MLSTFQKRPQLIQFVLDNAGNSFNYTMLTSLLAIPEFHPYVVAWWEGVPGDKDGASVAEQMKYHSKQEAPLELARWSVRMNDVTLMHYALQIAQKKFMEMPQVDAAKEAVAFGKVNCLLFLVENYGGCANIALRVAATCGHMRLLHAALLAGATDLNQALHRAAIYNQEEAAIALLHGGACNGRHHSNSFGEAFFEEIMTDRYK